MVKKIEFVKYWPYNLINGDYRFIKGERNRGGAEALKFSLRFSASEVKKFSKVMQYK